MSRFLAAAGWANASCDWLGQDASTRRYARLKRRDGARALLMDAPRIEADPCPPCASTDTRNEMGWNAQTRVAASRVDAFVLIASYLHSLGLSAPKVLAHDASAGFALLEDFGEGCEFARLIESGEADESTLYLEAVDVLAHLHRFPAPQRLEAGGECWPILEYDALALATNVDLYADWLPLYAGRKALSGTARRRWESVRDALIARAMSFPRVFTLRDYHAENLLWLPERSGIARVGLLDFQDAVIGWDAWDIAMLIQDARRPVSPQTAEAVIARYLDLTGQSRAAFDNRLAVIGALNALRIAGLFVRLIKRDRKLRYEAFLPRQFKCLADNLSHPDLADLAQLVREETPFIFETEP